MLTIENEPSTCILQILKEFRGLPINELFASSPFPVRVVADALEELHEKGLIKLSYPMLGRPKHARPATFSDIRNAVEKNGGDIPDPIFERGTFNTWQTFNDRLFTHFHKADDPSFFHTEANVTLRGHFAALLMPAQNDKLHLSERLGQPSPLKN